MLYKNYLRQSRTWVIPALYAVVAVAAGLTFPRFESYLFPRLVNPVNVSVAIAFYSTVASGMLSLTGLSFR